MTQINPHSTPIATSKTAALSRVLNLVPKGYIYYVSGECDAEKAISLADKFHHRYGIGCSPAQRLTHKGNGQANALLVMYWPGYKQQSGSQSRPHLTDPHAYPVGACLASESASRTASDAVAALASARSTANAPAITLRRATVCWLLLATKGEGAIHEQEKLRIVTDKPYLAFLGYELIRHQTRGKLSWTFRRRKPEMADWYALLASQLNRRQWSAVEKTLTLVSRQPGFAGVRQQSFELCQFARSRGYPGELPKLFFIEKIGQGDALVLG